MTAEQDRGYRVQDSDERFARWYELHHERLLSQCRRWLGDRSAAEDIAQETLLRAWLGRDRMREKDLGAWLSVVARNLCVSHVRRQKRAIPTADLPDTPDESADPARLIERLESTRAVRFAMREVEERHRKLLFLHEVDGIQYEELASTYGTSGEGARSMAFRARRVLRRKLRAVGEGFAAALFGTRVRLRSMLIRGRLIAPNADVAYAPAAPLIVNLALALGVALAAFGGSGSSAPAWAQAYANPRGLHAAAMTRPRLGSSSSATRSALTPSAARSEPDRSGLIRKPELSAPSVDGHPYNPGDGSSDIVLNVAGQSVELDGTRRPGDGFGAFYGVEDITFAILCRDSPELCSVVEGGRRS